MTTPEQFAVRDLRRVGYFTVDNEIIDDHATHIGAYGVAVYNVICRHARNETQVKLSARDIGATLGISHDRVRKSLADLVTRGLIHHEVAGPGVISTILLLNVKVTGRHTSSSASELDATRPHNKEVKQKLKTETPPPLLSEGFDFEFPRAREATETPKSSGREDLAKELCLEINFPATPGNVTAIAAALEAIRRQQGFATYQESRDWLRPRAEAGQERSISTRRGQFDRFFFEDAEYNHFYPWHPASQLSQEPLAPPECIVGKCKGCGRPKFEGSSWKDSDYCADSCRDAHERGTA